MNPRMCYIYRWLLGLVAVATLCGAPQQLSAQVRKVQNRPYIDMRRWHYGFLFGLHMQDMELTNNGYRHLLDDGTQEAWFADVASYTPGFSVGVLGELRLDETSPCDSCPRCTLATRWCASASSRVGPW